MLLWNYIFKLISMSNSKEYRLTLIEGDYFFGDKQKIEQYFNALFDHFSLLSWLTSASEARIHRKVDLENGGQKYRYYAFTINNSSKRSFLLEFNKVKDNKEISFTYFDNQESLLQCIKSNQPKQQKIKVILSSHLETSKLDKTKTRTVIFIDIIDKQDYFTQHGVTKFQRKISKRKNKLQKHQLHYAYQQPSEERNKVSPTCHFNLAFQGGGAKGVSYVGVYKALKEVHKGVPISSVIGSSAGGILALAISSEMSPADISNLCLEMDQIPLDKYFKTQADITPQIQKKFDQIVNKLKCLLHNYGLVEESIFDQILECLSDIETGNKLLRVLQCVNPSIAQLFSLELNKKVLIKKGSSKDDVEYHHRFNYYGILMAGMMRGNAVESIAATCLVSFIKRHLSPTYQKAHPQQERRFQKIRSLLKKWGYTENITSRQDVFEKQEFINKVKSLTLKQYYDINQIEFTCTSVDLDDKILRFFNHKTTPDLPVCKTVQMTGSFPVAFEAQKWKRQWGNYFIHYANTRKQVDLTGHTFTDGGLLANFPIKYLDNEHMRPMYFSHKQDPQKTILYGFGLDPIQTEVSEEQAAQKKQDLKQAMKDLKAYVKKKFSKLRLIKNLIMSDSSKKLNDVQLQEIPVIGFALKLMKTFTVADYNLNIQCFQKSIIQTPVQGRILSQNTNTKEQVEKYLKFDELLDNLQKMSLSKRVADPTQILTVSSEKLKQVLNEFQSVENIKIQEIKCQILESMYNYQGTRIRNNINQSSEVHKFIYTIQNIYPLELFKLQSTAEVKQSLILVISNIQAYFKDISEEQALQLKKSYEHMVNIQVQTIKKIRNRLKAILSTLRKTKKEQLLNDEASEATYIDYQLVLDLLSLERKFFVADKDFIREIINQIKKLDLPIISIDKQIMDRAQQITLNINNIIKSSKSNKIHLVFEAKQNSHLYYCGLYSILQEVLNEPFNQHKKIEMITCSDFHSVFAFLLAAGKKINNIRKEMWRVKDLIEMQKGIEEKYDQFRWAQTYSQQMNELLDITWKENYNLLDKVEQYLVDEKNSTLRSQIKSMKIQYLYSKDKVCNDMERVLSYVIQSSKAVQNIKNPTLRKKKLAQLLSLKNGKDGKDYEEKNKMISKNTQRIINKLMIHFEEVITYVILNNYLIQQTFQQFDQDKRQQLWKGFIIKKLLSSKKLQLYIKQKLEEMKLNSNTSLSEFYEFSPRKITLNFSLINKNEERLEIINRFTRPNMPLWAAIIASTSMPYLFPEFASKQSWQFTPFSDSRMRKLLNFFFDSQEQKLQTLYIAGNYVSALPLQFLTNQKIASENYTSNRLHEQIFIKANQLSQTTSSTFQEQQIDVKALTDFTYITFAFTKKETSNPQYQYNSSDRNFLTFSNALNLGLDYIFGKFKNFEVCFKDIMKRVQILKMISTRIQCHDNTIMHYYNDQTIKLPVRLGTLDFYKIDRTNQQNLNQCIYQAQFVVRGIFQNLKVESEKSFSYVAKQSTYLQYISEDDTITIKFPSKSKWNKKLATMYKVFYKTSKNHDYVEYELMPIKIKKANTVLFLKFCFPNMQTFRLQEQEMKLDLSKLALFDKQNLIFRFQYDTIQKNVLKGIEMSFKKLKSKILSTLRQVPSECAIEQSAANLYISKKSSAMISDEETSEKVLIIIPIINFKHNGLYCPCCTHKLKRSLTHNSLELNTCGKCSNQSLIALQCTSSKCAEREKNQYCFQCLLVYLIKRQNGKYTCNCQNHAFQYFDPINQSPISLCHFCSSAANKYYKDDKCNITICFKCSLVLDSKIALSL